MHACTVEGEVQRHLLSGLASGPLMHVRGHVSGMPVVVGLQVCVQTCGGHPALRAQILSDQCEKCVMYDA